MAAPACAGSFKGGDPVMKLPILKSRGFTLLEIVIVVAFLCLIAAVIVPSYLPPQIHGRRPNRYSCIANLKQIDSAQEQWAIENHKDSNSPTVLVEITAYLKNNVLPTEPFGGTYTIGATVKDLPKCSNAKLGHTF